MVDVDTVFELLRDDRRRHAIYYLEEQETPVSIDELAEVVATMEAEEDDENPADAEAVEFDLQHTHLPKADEANFIEYNRDEGVVRLTGDPPTFEALVTVAEVVETGTD